MWKGFVCIAEKIQIVEKLVFLQYSASLESKVQGPEDLVATYSPFPILFIHVLKSLKNFVSSFLFNSSSSMYGMIILPNGLNLLDFDHI